jgi:hypothetical protein
VRRPQRRQAGRRRRRPRQQGTVAVGAAQRLVNGVDIARAADQLVIYTRANGQTVSPANQWGFEVAV